MSDFFKRLFLIFILTLNLSACKGGELCGPLSDPQTDSDSDCIPDESDNCPLDYNGGQVDLDEDGLGNVCDENDDDDTCGPVREGSDGDCTTAALIRSPLLGLSAGLTSLTDYVFPDTTHTGELAHLDLENSDCTYYLLSCDNQFLGYLDATEAASLEETILDPLGFYGRSFTSCSAFNESAPYPPALICERSSLSETLIGYLTRNPNVENGFDACETLESLGLSHPECE